MADRKQWRALYDDLFALYGELGCPLDHATPFRLLCAVMLSAQCRDDRVNEVTKELFRVAPDPAAMAELDVARIAEIIKPCGLYHNKSENLSKCAKMLMADFGGEVPRTMDELTKLPGIGRKSANVVLGNAFGIPGFPADTHVIRVLNRIGYVSTSDPVRIEAEVNAKTPPELWTNFSHLIIVHGRRVCHAGAHPECEKCPLSDRCRHFRSC
ncbi:endonuclease III [uncultured Victivallis sp.]|uniref:endonuclease III n=1 Tax=uncultured Victivallis sp. TaxID=354118 RepID=UPI0025D4C936|nr:endonuclease III [uncultured Victivallis sp.]